MDRKGDRGGKKDRIGPKQFMTGKVSIIGAGPGPADLLTVRAAAALRSAQVVLHDDLVSAEVLELCPPTARLYNVGKRRGRRGISQEQINALMVHHARHGCAVVRLKSGDPAIFGRLGEELDALRDAGIPFEIIPGITAAVAAAAAVEVTLTDRRAASALLVLTGHYAGDEIKPRTLLDVERTTFAVYMPGPDYSRTARELIALGIDAATPCAVVSNACSRNQKVRFLSLAGLENTQGIFAPAVLIVGKVAAREDASFRMLSAEVPSVARDPYHQEQA